MKHRMLLVPNGLCLAALLCAALLFPAAAHAGLAPENVAVVVNADSWASKAVANEFVALHGVPPMNVVYLSNLDSYETASVDTFRNGIIKPVLTVLTQRSVAQQIDCLVYAPDIPMAVDIRGDFPDGPSPKAVGAFASVTGLTYLHEPVFSEGAGYTALNANRYYRDVLVPVAEPDLSEEQAAMLGEAIALMKQKKWAPAAAALATLGEEQPRSAYVHFRHAECLAEMGDAEAALAALERSVESGLYDGGAVEKSPHLVVLHDRAAFKEILERIAGAVVTTKPVTAFRHAYAWTPDGERAADGKGVRYLLSTMLAATSGRGNSVDEAIACLRRSAGVDGSSPEGTFYFARNDDFRSTARAGLFPGAVSSLRAMGMKAEIIEGVLPANRFDVVGLAIGATSFDWAGSGSTILPGAICESFTGYGGVLAERGKETPLTEFLRNGAAGSCGTVDEPLAVARKFPSPFLHAYYAAGCSLAEAFYQAVAAPYQLLIVGDPLCAPWARRPMLSLEGLAPGAEIEGLFEMRPVITGLDGRGVAYYELYIDGVRRAVFSPGQTPSADSAQLADGIHELTLVVVLDDAVETRARVSVAAVVDNQGRSVTVREMKRTTFAWDEPLLVEASAPGAEGILLLHNQRVVGTVRGAAGTAEINLRAVGQGPVRIQTVAVMDAKDADGVFGPVIELEVVPPPLAPAMEAPTAGTLAPGLMLRVAGAPPVAIAETWAGDWLEKAGASGKAFSLEGVFEVPDDGVYQFQVRANFTPELSVDGAGIGRPEAGYWRFFPVALAKGMHRLGVSGEAAEAAPELRIRFGGKGTHSLSSETFMHPAEPAR